MAIFKCKMCGGALEINNNETVATCEYCGTQQTLPKLDDDRKANLYDRANHFRRNNEFDKAMGIYEQILNEDNSDAESYWSLVLCRYGIEYVEDPATHKRVPTVNRAQFTSIFDDEDYKSALKYADGFQKEVYEAEAKVINEIQKGILAISQQEEPFDVFICYKETDSNGRRTQDSVIATELYHELTREGYKVFFSRITLEDKLGTAYEPYIFAALNSAKVMVVLGTKPEYFNAVWGKNEWSRYLSLIKNGAKKILIPAYRDMDPYDLPEEFSHLQAQDMSKLGFMHDLIRGINKLVKTEEPKPTVVKETVITGGNANIDSLLKRAFMFLEDGAWNSADEYCEKVLDINPENAQAYLGKLMAELQVSSKIKLKNCAEPFDKKNNYQKILRYGDEELKNEITSYIDFINNRNKNARLQSLYDRAKNAMNKAFNEYDFKDVAQEFKKIIEYKDSSVLATFCLEKAEEKRKEAEAAKEKAAEEKKRIAALYDEYKLSMKYEKSLISEKTKANEQITELESRHSSLMSLKENWQQIEDELQLLEKELTSAQNEIDSLKREKSNLGIFAGKMKKEIANKISILDNKQTSLKGKIEVLQASKLGYADISELEKSITQNEHEISNKKKFFDKLSVMRSVKSIRDELIVYKDGKLLIEKINRLLNCKTGDYINFGTYKQDDKSNSKQKIEWQILDVKDGKALIISKYALDFMSYHYQYSDVTWENCYLRGWLNDMFMDKAFSSAEKSVIFTTTVSADKNPKYNTNPGNATKDKIFLLSITEVNKYFTSQWERRCSSTKYAGAIAISHRLTPYQNSWWLRTPGQYAFETAYVASDGDIMHGRTHLDGFLAVRPAMWISLEGLISIIKI